MAHLRLWTAVLAVASTGFAQTSGSAQAQGSAAQSGPAAVQSQQSVQAVLTKSVDAKKAKEGDAVEAKTSSALKTAGNVDLPKGTKLVGHVTQVKAHEKGSEDSKLGILFEKAVLKSGQEVPFHALILAAAVPQNPMAGSDTGMDAGLNAGAAAGVDRASDTAPVGSVTNAAGGVVNGVGSTAGALSTGVAETAGNAGNTVGRTVGGQPTTGLSTSNRAVVGLPGVALDAQASNSTNGTVFRSDRQNVKLDSGTLILLRVLAQ